MKLAFVLFHYFPYGGLERDMLAIASACAARGHQVIIYTQEWIGNRPDGIEVKEIRSKGYTNHGRAMSFAVLYQQALEVDPVDLVIGFNKMPGLDIYFAADVCFAQKVFEERSWLYRKTWRCRDFLKLEESVFSVDSKTHIMIIAPAQIAAFQKYYHTPDDRMYLLPPGIRRDRVMPENYRDLRKGLRQHYGLVSDDYLLLMVGSDFRRKGVERAIRALAKLPMNLRKRAKLWVVGRGDTRHYVKLAEHVGVVGQLTMLGARDDVAQLMWAADMFLHPAYSEAAGAVLLEAAVAGLPVIATDVCGYAKFIQEMSMGEIISSEDADLRLADIIARVSSCEAAEWFERSRLASNSFDIFSMVNHATALIESSQSDLSFDKRIMAGEA